MMTTQTVRVEQGRKDVSTDRRAWFSLRQRRCFPRDNGHVGAVRGVPYVF